MQAHPSHPRRQRRPWRIPLYAQVLIAVALGATLGVFFKTEPWISAVAFRNEHLGELGMLVITLLKALAVPLIFLAILDAFIKTRFTARQGGKLILICAVNVSVAMCIGLLIMNLFRPGASWQGQLESMSQTAGANQAKVHELFEKSHKGTLSPMQNIASYIPKSVVDPFIGNGNVITVVLLAIFTGAALRAVRRRQLAASVGMDQPSDLPPHPHSITNLEHVIEASYQVVVQMLEWVVLAIPYAVLGIVASVVGREGLGVFKVVWVFLATIAAGLLIHSLVYYPLVAWVVGRKSPRIYLGKGMDAVLTGLSVNSSLATVPITLRSLDRMNVSPTSARLAACVGTNLNNDGITLYEAMAALFLCQALGYPLDFSHQLIIILAAIMAGAGVAGIPEAGLIVLPLVLGAAGLPESVIAVAIPLIMTVDWILARMRSGVNVMSDMVVAILLDRGNGATQKETKEPREMEVAA